MSALERGRSLVLILAIAFVCGQLELRARQTPTSELVGLQQDLVVQSLAASYERSSEANDRDARRFREMQEKDRRLRSVIRQLASDDAALTTALRDIDTLNAERLSMYKARAADDLWFRGQLAAQEQVIADLLMGVTPTMRQYLRQFAEGDTETALALIKQQDAKEYQDDKQRHVRNLQFIAFNTETLMVHGQKTIQESLSEWHAAQEADSSNVWGWMAIARLNLQLGDLEQARLAASDGLAVARGPIQRAAALNALSDVLLISGFIQQAQTQLEASVQLLQTDDERPEDSLERERDLSAAFDRLGDVQLIAGDLTGAEAQFRKALEIRQRLVVSSASESIERCELCVSLDRVGTIRLAVDDIRTAHDLYKDSLDRRERVMEAHPNNLEIRRDVVVSLVEFAQVLARDDDLGGARQHLVRALGLARSVDSVEPTSVRARRDFAVVSEHLASILESSGELEEAQHECERSMQVRDNLATADGASPQAQRDLSVSLEQCGDFALRDADWLTANRHFARAIKIRESLFRSSQSRSDAARDLSVSFEKLGDVLVASGQPREGLERLNQAVSLRERIAASSSVNESAQREFAHLLADRGRALLSLKRPSDSERDFERALSVLRSIAHSETHSVLTLRAVNATLEMRGQALLSYGSIASARGYLTQACDGYHDLTEQSTRPTPMREFVTCLEQLSKAFIASRDFHSARSVLENAVRLREADLDSGEPSRRSALDLGMAREALGDVLLALDRSSSKARELYRLALEVRQREFERSSNRVVAQRELLSICAKVTQLSSDRRGLVKVRRLSEALHRKGRLGPDEIEHLKLILAVERANFEPAAAHR